jgi:cell division protein FtsN
MPLRRKQPRLAQPKNWQPSLLLQQRVPLKQRPQRWRRRPWQQRLRSMSFKPIRSVAPRQQVARGAKKGGPTPGTRAALVVERPLPPPPTPETVWEIRADVDAAGAARKECW